MSIMTEEQILARFFKVVQKGLRHKHYNRTKEVRKRCQQLVAGIGLDQLLKQYVKRENADLFEQRVRLTNHVVTAVCKNLLDPFYKVPRSNSARRILTYQLDEKQKEKKIKELQSVLTKFWGIGSFSDYMNTRYAELNSLDPNTYTVFEWADFNADEELLQPKPYESNALMTVDVKKNNRVLEYLTVMDDHRYKVHQEIDNGIGKQDEYKEGKKYTLYGKNKTWTLKQIDSKLGQTLVTDELKPTKAKIEGANVKVMKLNKQFFIFNDEIAPHNCGRVPAIEIGYNRDMQTNGETFVSPLHAAEPYLLKSIKTNSELDLVASNLALPQQIRYGFKCEDIKCNGGLYPDGRTECKTCSGTGIKPSAPSTMDAIVIQLPNNPDELLPLKDLIAYVSPDVNIVKWQEDYIEKLTVKARQIMYNSETFTLAAIHKTAAGEHLDANNVYDTLFPFATALARNWTFGVNLIAKLTDRDEKLLASLTFNKDFKMKGLDKLIVDLKTAHESGSTVLVKHIKDDIAQIVFDERPMEKQRYDVQQAFNPMSGKSDKEITYLLGSGLITRRNKVLYANMGVIFDELELDMVTNKNADNFYKLSRADQSIKIMEKVDAIIEKIDADTPAPVLPE